MAPVIVDGEDIEKKVFQLVAENDLNGLKSLFAQNKIAPDIYDDNGMTPLQNAAFKGNKDIVQMFLDQGADVNSGRHDNAYSALHFAALSGNSELCQLLLAAGAKTHVTNSVGRTASQMAAFVGNHNCVAVINNFFPKSAVDYYTTPQGLETKPKLPAILASPLHKFVLQVNIHPIRVALNLQPTLINHLEDVKKVLELMSAREMRRSLEANEVISFKLHYLSCVVGEVIRCKQPEKLSDPVELFVKKILRSGRGEEYLERFIHDCVREFPYRECTIFRQMVASLARGNESPPAISVITTAVNGQRAFIDSDIPACCTCGTEKALKKCSKCKKVQYCDRECQRLHWFAHKKECERPVTSVTSACEQLSIGSETSPVETNNYFCDTKTDSKNANSAAK